MIYSGTVNGMDKEIKRNRRKRRSRYTLIMLIFMEIVLVIAGVSVIILMKSANKEDPLLNKEVVFEYYTEERETEPAFFVDPPEISEQLLTINEWSRPGKKIKELDYIVIHYLGNPRTTAQENHDYFESLKNLQNTSMSANYVIGMEGEIIHCVPDDEVAYASNRMNSYSISIENCHPDETGKFTDETYRSLVHLTAYLSERYGLGRDQIIRHYDVTEKICPKYFVEHTDKWEEFLDDVMMYRESAREQVLGIIRVTEAEDKELSDFLEQNVDGM